MVRPDSYRPLRLRPLTYKGEVAHEADGTTVGCDSGRIRTSVHQSVRHVACRKVGSPRWSEPRRVTVTRQSSVGRRSGSAKANCMGPSIDNLAALLMRGSESSRVVGPSIGSSTVNNNPAGLMSRIRLRRVWCHRNWDMLSGASSRLAATKVPTVSTIQGETTGV